jgi:hypothetical protein
MKTKRLIIISLLISIGTVLLTYFIKKNYKETLRIDNIHVGSKPRNR